MYAQKQMNEMFEQDIQEKQGGFHGGFNLILRNRIVFLNLILSKWIQLSWFKLHLWKRHLKIYSVFYWWFSFNLQCIKKPRTEEESSLFLFYSIPMSSFETIVSFCGLVRLSFFEATLIAFLFEKKTWKVKNWLKMITSNYF